MDINKQHFIKLISFVLVICGLILVFKINFFHSNMERTHITNPWTVTVNDNVYVTEDLESLYFPMVDKGDYVELQVELPESEYVQVTFEMRLQASAVRIYLDGVELYEYGHQYAKRHQMVGNGVIWLTMPTDYVGKTLRICLDVQENEAFSKIQNVYLEGTQNLYRNMIYNNFNTLLVIGFMYAFALIALTATFLLHDRQKRMETLFWVACFAWLVATWLLCYSRLIQLFTSNFHFIAQLEYLSLYLAPICMLFFIYDLISGTRYDKIIRGVGIAFALVDALLIFLNYTNIAHFCRTLYVYDLMVIVCGISSIVIGIIWAKNTRKPAGWIFVGGISLFVLFAMIDMIRHLIDHYGNMGWGTQATFMPLGFVLFVSAMFLSFEFLMMEKIAENMERKTLLYMAYTDALTNIGNRAKCEEVFGKYETEQTKVTVINIDLNDFKTINDTYGHAVGDELLMRFATILENTFHNRGFVGRMGGDEFVVVVPDAERDSVEEDMEQLQKNIKWANDTSGCPYQISISYGCADNQEGNLSSVWKVYEKADRRMYKYKRNIKKKNGGK